jgi:transcriptional regulator with XRE-family HTH domain
MKDKHKGFGLYLRQKRRDAGLSQHSVAKALGYSSPQFISNLERGTCPIPLVRIRQFIDLYKIDENEFVHRYLREQEATLRKYISAKDLNEQEQRKAN